MLEDMVLELKLKLNYWTKTALENVIKAYQPVLVIDACTGKNDGSVYRPQDTLHNMIMCYLCKNLRDCKIMSTYHPARASNFKNTNFHRIVTNPPIL
jgi:hypothetical protein